MGLVVVSPMATVSTLIGSPEARAALASLAASFAWNAQLVDIETVGGYATWKIGIFIFVIAIWPLLAGSRMLRGEEERGSMDMLLSLPRRRVRVAIEKLAAMWTALLAMGLLIGLVAYAGGQRFDAAFDLEGALLFGLDLALVCGVIGGVALVVSQFTLERSTAAGVTAAALMVFIVVDMVHRIVPGAEWLSRLSPIYYYNLSKPLVPSYGTSTEGLLVLLGLAIVLDTVGVWLFTRRDVGGTVRLEAWGRPLVPAARAARPAPPLPEGDWSLRSIYTRSLGMIALATFWWTLGIATFAVWTVIAVKLIESRLSELYTSTSYVKDLIQKVGGGDVATNATLLSAIFMFVPILLMAFAVTQVNRWSADEEDGRLELVLSTPQSRLVVLLGRFAALATSTVVIGVVTMIACGVAAAAVGLRLDYANLAAATLGMIPLGLLVAAIGYLGSGWLRTAADTGLVSFLLAFWFLVSFVGPELSWPDATLRLSAFYYYGTPLLHGLQLTSMLAVVLAGAIALALGSLRFVRKDIGR
jgi:ABC-2 type transport system permease protein